MNTFADDALDSLGSEKLGSDNNVGSDKVDTCHHDKSREWEVQDSNGVVVRAKRSPDDLDMTPMVDVTFLLLIFFMVTASFGLPRSIEMPRQTSEFPSPSPADPVPNELDPIGVHINNSGSLLVLAQNWQREPTGKQNLISALKEAVGGEPLNSKLDIRVDENAKLQKLVDAIDAATIAGLVKIQVTQVDGETRSY